MFGQIPSKEIRKAQMVSSVAHLPMDMRRMLRVQFKEFIHHIEDCQSGWAAAEKSNLTCQFTHFDRSKRLAS